MAANTEKVQPMIQNFKIRFFSNLMLHIIQTVQIQIEYLFALDTDDVRMGVRLIPIIPVAPIREPQFEKFIK